mgnify:CR=1 FL=1
MQLEMFDTEIKEVEPSELTKYCRYCDKTLPMEHFRLRYKGYVPIGTRGRDHVCRPCTKAASIKVKTLKETAPPKPKDNKCQCCRKPVGSFYFDHCHKSETFRGWVCRSCNVGIGFLGDDLEGVEKAETYLRNHYES